jgi:SpoVK/Ycf46/Vps4 family AAA+-type ATPase
MLCYLDGVEQIEGVFVIAITSRPDMVDPALTRPGRLDLVVLCDIPTEEEKLEIVKHLYSEFLGIEPSGNICVELTRLIPYACTGADIRSGFVDAKICAKRKKLELNLGILQETLAQVAPAIPPAEVTHLNRIFAKYRHHGRSVDLTEVGTKAMLR